MGEGKLDMPLYYPEKYRERTLGVTVTISIISTSNKGAQQMTNWMVEYDAVDNSKVQHTKQLC